MFIYILITGTGFGDPHVFTLDGFAYTFNGLGEYVLLQMRSIDLVVQARTRQAVNGTGDHVHYYTKLMCDLMTQWNDNYATYP